MSCALHLRRDRYARATRCRAASRRGGSLSADGHAFPGLGAAPSRRSCWSSRTSRARCSAEYATRSRARRLFLRVRARRGTPGTLYRYRFGDGAERFPDPASRFQPLGPHGPSQVVDPTAFAWTDAAWRGVALERQVLYEMHVGTFTEEGTWLAALEQLPALADLGITDDRDDAGRRVRRAATAGATTASICLRRATSTARPDDLRRFVDARAPASASASSSTSSTTTSARTAISSRSSRRRYFSTPLRERMGRGHQLRRRCGGRCGSS